MAEPYDPGVWEQQARLRSDSDSAVFKYGGPRKAMALQGWRGIVPLQAGEITEPVVGVAQQISDTVLSRAGPPSPLPVVREWFKKWRKVQSDPIWERMAPLQKGFVRQEFLHQAKQKDRRLLDSAAWTSLETEVLADAEPGETHPGDSAFQRVKRTVSPKFGAPKGSTLQSQLKWYQWERQGIARAREPEQLLETGVRAGVHAAIPGARWLERAVTPEAYERSEALRTQQGRRGVVAGTAGSLAGIQLNPLVVALGNYLGGPAGRVLEKFPYFKRMKGLAALVKGGQATSKQTTALSRMMKLHTIARKRVGSGAGLTAYGITQDMSPAEIAAIVGLNTLIGGTVDALRLRGVPLEDMVRGQMPIPLPRAEPTRIGGPKTMRVWSPEAGGIVGQPVIGVRPRVLPIPRGAAIGRPPIKVAPKLPLLQGETLKRNLSQIQRSLDTTYQARVSQIDPEARKYAREEYKKAVVERRVALPSGIAKPGPHDEIDPDWYNDVPLWLKKSKAKGGVDLFQWMSDEGIMHGYDYENVASFTKEILERARLPQTRYGEAHTHYMNAAHQTDPQLGQLTQLDRRLIELWDRGSVNREELNSLARAIRDVRLGKEPELLKAMPMGAPAPEAPPTPMDWLEDVPKEPWEMTSDEFLRLGTAFEEPSVYKAIEAGEGKAAASLAWELHRKGVPTISTHRHGGELTIRAWLTPENRQRVTTSGATIGIERSPLDIEGQPPTYYLRGVPEEISKAVNALEPQGRAIMDAVDAPAEEEMEWAAEFVARHEAHVQEAVKAGKPVPPEVLREYPELAGRVPLAPEDVAEQRALAELSAYFESNGEALPPKHLTETTLKMAFRHRGDAGGLDIGAVLGPGLNVGKRAGAAMTAYMKGGAAGQKLEIARMADDYVAYINWAYGAQDKYLALGKKMVKEYLNQFPVEQRQVKYEELVYLAEDAEAIKSATGPLKEFLDYREWWMGEVLGEMQQRVPTLVGVKNYLRHMIDWKASGVQSAAERVAKLEQMDNALPAFISRVSPSLLKHRKHGYFKEYEAFLAQFKVVPKKDVLALDGSAIWDSLMMNATRDMMKTASDTLLPVTDGDKTYMVPLLTPKPAPGLAKFYRRLPQTDLDHYWHLLIGDAARMLKEPSVRAMPFGQDIFVHKKFYDLFLNIAPGAFRPSGLVRFWNALVSWQKAVIFVNPMIYGKNQFSDGFIHGVSLLNPLKGFANIAKTWKDGSRMLRDSSAEESHWFRTAVQSGVNISRVHELSRYMVPVLDQEATKLEKVLNVAKKGLMSWPRLSAWVCFEGIGPRLMLGSFKHLDEYLAAKAPKMAVGERRRIAAHVVNETFGRPFMHWFPRAIEIPTRQIMIARNWTIGNWDIVTKAIARRGLGTAGLTPEQM